MDAVLANILKPLSKYYDDVTTVEIRMNQPCVLVVDRRGQGKAVFHDDSLNIMTIEHICAALANKAGTKFHADRNPKLSCIIPEVRHRFECLVGASVQGGLSLAVRCKHEFVPDWTQLGADQVIQDYLYDAIVASKNIVISGATNSGKTTLLNMLLEIIPDSRRVIGMEDTPELVLDRFFDGVALQAGRDDDNTAGMVSWRQLSDHTLRITPDHIIFGEISSTNAFPALTAMNSGITGFMCTIHADSPYQALYRRFDHNLHLAGTTMPGIPAYLGDLIDVVVQIRRDPDGMRRISHIYEPRQDRYVIGVPTNGQSLAEIQTASEAVA